MSNEETNQNRPSFSLGKCRWVEPLSWEQRCALSKEDLEKYKAVEKELRERKKERKQTIELEKKQVLALRERSLEISMLSDEILKITEKINLVDSNEIGMMLMKQASVLQEFFRVFLGRMDMDQSFSGKTIFAKLALQAQSLSRKTLATLIELQNPKRSPTFIKQQNNAQINVNSKQNKLKRTSEN